MRDYIYIPLLILFAFFALYTAYKNQKLIEEHTKNLSTEIKVKDEVIKQNQDVQIRRTINEAASPDDNLKWLRKHRCQDCSNR